MTRAERMATEHMRTQDVLEAEPVRVERAFLAGFRAAVEMAEEVATKAANTFNENQTSIERDAAWLQAREILRGIRALLTEEEKE
jgi:hypothetical protein